MDYLNNLTLIFVIITNILSTGSIIALIYDKYKLDLDLTRLTVVSAMITSVFIALEGKLLSTFLWLFVVLLWVYQLKKAKKRYDDSNTN